MSKYISIDVEADGPVPHLYSMVSFGAVIVEPGLNRTFYGETAPISENWDAESLSISGFSRDEHLTFDDPKIVMENFRDWIIKNSKGNPVFMSDNPAFDWQWINYYFHKYIGNNPFGYSARRIGDLFCGFYKDPYYSWKKHRNNEKYPHNHDPVSDSQGNASALLWLKEQGLKIKF